MPLCDGICYTLLLYIINYYYLSFFPLMVVAKSWALS